MLGSIEVSAAMQNPAQEARAAAPQLVDEQAAARVEGLIQSHLSEGYLNLRKSKLYNAEAIALAERLKGNNDITVIDLAHNEIGDEGVEALANGLRNNRSIKRLSLENNKIGEKGGVALAQVLEFNTSLELLSLTTNSIGYHATLAFAHVLGGANTSLDSLFLVCNPIKDLEAETLFEAIEETDKFIHRTAINLRVNRLSEGVREELRKRAREKEVNFYV